MSLLEVTGLNSYYGDDILFDVALRVEKVVADGSHVKGTLSVAQIALLLARPRNPSPPCFGVLLMCLTTR